jgi:hypothetical protein
LGHEISKAKELTGCRRIDRATAILVTGLIVTATIIHTPFFLIVARRHAFEIAGVKFYGLVAGKLLAHIGVIIPDGLRLHILNALALVQIAAFMAVILSFAALNGA